MMPDLHYSDALLTVIFGGAICFAMWQTNAHISNISRLSAIEESLKWIKKRLGGDEDDHR